MRVRTSEWSVEHISDFLWWFVYCVVGVGVCTRSVCLACIPPTVTVLGCCYSCVMQSLAKQIQTDPKIVYQSGLTPAKVSLHIHLHMYLLHTHVAHGCAVHTYVHMCIQCLHTRTHTNTCMHTHARTHTHTHTHRHKHTHTTHHPTHNA